MEHTEISFTPLLIVTALAFLVPLLLSRLKGLAIPIVVGEIIAGIIVGQSGLNDLMLPGDVTVLMIERGGDILIPDRETALRANDTVTLVGADTDVDDAARLFARNGG